jgi:hypothetical protein
LVSVIIPARNEEASISRAVWSVSVQPEIGEVIVVNDQSTDHTAAILERLAASVPKLKILTVDRLPAGWVGKSYAASLGALAASGDWLLFTDADTYHFPGSARRALADAIDHNAVLVSYSPEQETETFWERVMIPFVYCRLAARFSFARVNDPRSPDAAANGQFLMVLGDVYRAIGGHATVSDQVLEDLALARLVKREGFGIYFTAPMGVVRTRMYRSFGGMWQGWTKNLYPLMGGTVQSMLLELVEVSPLLEAFLLLLALLYFQNVRPALLAPTVGWMVALLLCGLARYAAVLHRNLYPIRYIQYYLPGSILYSVALLASWWKNTRGAVIWKGREYAARNL